MNDLIQIAPGVKFIKDLSPIKEEKDLDSDYTKTKFSPKKQSRKMNLNIDVNKAKGDLSHDLNQQQNDRTLENSLR